MTTTALRHPALSPAEAALSYHERTRHQLNKYAAGPETLDWTTQPSPFREFAAAPRTNLPLTANEITAHFAEIHRPGLVAARPFNLSTIGAFLQLSMGVSAWKEYGPDRWAVRCNPSSGNLHPTEAYLVCRLVEGLHDGVYHYVSRDHALERRCQIERFDRDVGDAAPNLWVGLSSIHWREAWKYGERAFRYCQLDLGHALGALRYAAGALGWTMRLVESCGSRELGSLLGLDRDQDFGSCEREEPDVLLAITPGAVWHQSESPTVAQTVPRPVFGPWSGQANRLDPHPMYRWPVIDEVAAATASQGIVASASPSWPRYPDLLHTSQALATEVILGRRSAQAFDRKFRMSAAHFYHLLESLLPRPTAPWDIWGRGPHAHPVLFVHRVEGLGPGLYALARDNDAEASLRSTLRPEFTWQRPDGAPQHLPLYQLAAVDCSKVVRTLSCHQAIAADGAFSLGLLTELEPIVRDDPWRYRQLHWEAGLVGHVLYLTAEALGLRGTGIGCFFDDAVHEMLGLTDRRFASLYHFTVGRPRVDERIATLPPYSHLDRQEPSP